MFSNGRTATSLGPLPVSSTARWALSHTSIPIVAVTKRPSTKATAALTRRGGRAGPADGEVGAGIGGAPAVAGGRGGGAPAAGPKFPPGADRSAAAPARAPARAPSPHAPP